MYTSMRKYFSFVYLYTALKHSFYYHRPASAGERKVYYDKPIRH